MKPLSLILLLTLTLMSARSQSNLQVKVSNGLIEGVDMSGIRAFKGVPYAAPPIGDLRWREPQPASNWSGVRKADKFGPRAMQRALFGDMGFRSDGISEDCLYLNVWTPASSGKENLPVLVYFYGGGFMAGDGSEPRYDGESLARRGIVTVTVNYRLTVFGFFSHPELTKESPHHASGNQGLLDQAFALKWVRDNIAAFGGDPKRVTIAGESAGSFSVCAQMATPLARNLIAGAIGESGSLLGQRTPTTLAEGERKGLKFGELAGGKTLAELRKMSSQQILELSANHEWDLFPVVVDGFLFPKSPTEIFEKGEQARVPLMAGWNSMEGNGAMYFGKDEPTKENLAKAIKRMYPDKADAMLKAYNPATDAEALQVATEMASDAFIGFGTWKWIDVHARTSAKPTYRYYYERPRPAMRPEMGNATPGLAGGIVKSDAPAAKPKPADAGAVHSAEIEYALGNLSTNRVYDWQPEDQKVSEIMQSMFANFIKTGNPNGLGTPNWPAVKPGVPAAVMRIDAWSRAETEKNRERYLIQDGLLKK